MTPRQPEDALGGSLLRTGRRPPDYTRLVAARGAAAKRGTTIEIGQNKLRLDAAAQLAKLVGLDIKRVQVTGADGAPLLPAPHPVEILPPKLLAARFRVWADDLELEELAP